MPALLIVNNVGDNNGIDPAVGAGTGTLRQAIVDANAPSNPGPDVIQFDVGAEGSSQTIRLDAGLPPITETVMLDGLSQGIAGYTGPPLIELDGTNADPDPSDATLVHGLQINSSANVIRGLVINRFTGDGIRIEGGTGNRLFTNFIGTNAAGDAIMSGMMTPLGNGGAGVRIMAGASANYVGTDDTNDATERNIISGNATAGVALEGSGNFVAGNFIGTNGAGADLGNGGDGINVTGAGNRIGTDATVDALERNVISGNDGHGIEITGSGATDNLVDGNYVGLAPNGTDPLANSTDGINVNAGSTGTLIGVTAPNVISGNGDDGIEVTGIAANGTGSSATAVNNRIGVDAATPPVGVPNSVNAVVIGAGARLMLTSATAGELVGNVSNLGTLAPGASPGIVNITGNYVQGATGNLEIEVQGAAATAGTDYDQLNVSGDVTLGGTLTVVVVPMVGFTQPAIPATATFLTAGAFVPPDTNFADVVIPRAGAAPRFVLQRGATTFSLRSAIIVNSTDDPGVGGPGAGGPTNDETTLREAIDLANDTAGADYIYFNIPADQAVGGIFTITPATALPAIDPVAGAGADQAVVIDATTQMGFTATPVVVIDGSAADPDRTDAILVDGLTILSSGNTIRGLTINGFTGDAVEVAAGTANVITRNHLGTNAAGTVAVGNGGAGVHVSGTATGTIIGANATEGNLISGNGVGVFLETNANVVAGNRIGTNAAGTMALGNLGSGVRITGANNRVGTDDTTASASPEANVIVGNGFNGGAPIGHGVEIFGAGASGNLVAGNFIGTNAASAANLGNALDGVFVNAAGTTADPANVIGGDSVARRNVISGNRRHGIEVTGAGAPVVIQGNYVGTNVAGDADLGNTLDGVSVNGNATAVTVGSDDADGDDAAERNVISGNDGNNVSFRDTATGNFLRGNYVGTNAAGTAPIETDPTVSGVGVLLATSGVTTVGGLTAMAGTGLGNVISGNVTGIRVEDGAPVIQGNVIGLAANGTDSLPLPPPPAPGNNRQTTGVRVNANATGLIIGGALATARNVISGNNGVGVLITGVAANLAIQGNYIGTDRTGTMDRGNLIGVRIEGNVDTITVGGATATPGTGVGNVISGNDVGGVQVENVGADAPQDVLVQGNLIGSAADGLLAIGNGPTSGSSAGFYAVSVVGTGAGDNVFIGTNGDGTADADEGNVISGNFGVGVRVSDADAVIIAGNFIGVDVNGSPAAVAMALGNAQQGVLIEGASEDVRVGGATTEERNVISGNVLEGILVRGVAVNHRPMRTVIYGNYVGLDASGTVDRGNGGDGIRLTDGATDTNVGDPVFNFISGNGGDGIEVSGDGTTASAQFNRIGVSTNMTTIRNDGLAINVTPGATLVASSMDGQLRGDVVNAGTLSPGRVNAIGLLDVNAGPAPPPPQDGDFTQAAAGTLAIQLMQVMDVTTIDRIVVDGDAVLDGNLNVTLLGAFVPPPATDFVFLTYGGLRTGTFDTTDLPPNVNGVPLFAVVYDDANKRVLLRSTIVVNSTLDTEVADDDLTLREAIDLANDTPGFDNIVFDILGTGVRTITVTSALPPIMEEVSIDGRTQPGFSAPANMGRPLIEINGGNLNASGLVIAGGDPANGVGSSIRALSIYSFAQHGIQISADTFNTLTGNYLGQRADGTPAGNGLDGVRITTANNTVGGPNAGDGNVITANGGDGVGVVSGAGNTISRNSIFTNGDLGIDLAPGANNDQPAPVLTGVALTSTTQLTVAGNLNRVAGEDYLIEFFANNSANDPEGRFFLGSFLLDDAAPASFVSGPLTAPTPLIGTSVITATATRVTTRDTSEFSAARGLFVVTNANDADHGSLRQAILNANIIPGLNTITFEIPGPDFTIDVASALPPIMEEVIIDGASQMGYAGTPLIEINGAGAGMGADASGLRIAGGDPANGVGSSIRALSIYSFAQHGVQISADTFNTLTGNFIGQRADGTPAGNGLDGVFVATANNVVGGATTMPGTGLGNVIRANGSHGVEISGALANGNLVQGNGIFANAADGVAVLVGTGNTITRNNVFDNGGLGIDLGNDGRTLNDAGDVDTGANNLQNFPELSGVALINTTQFTVAGSLNGVAPGDYVIEYFVNTVADPSTFGEGMAFLGAQTVTVAANGNSGNFVSMLLTAPAPLIDTSVITATATILRDGTTFTATGPANTNLRVPPTGTGGTGVGFPTLPTLTNADTQASTISVSGLTQPLTDVNVRVRLPHAFSGDLNLRLVAPDGTIVPLSSRNGGSAVNAYGDTTFDDQAALSATGATPPFGRVRPQSLLAVLNGLPAAVANGNWILQINDDAGSDVGTLIDWSITFNSSSETSEFSFARGLFVVTNTNDLIPNTNDAVHGSLRQAILNANIILSPFPNRITFEIPGAGVQTINVGTPANPMPLPAITDEVIIDGTSQMGYAMNMGRPLIEINGTAAGAGASGLVIAAGHLPNMGSTISALSIYSFTQHGIQITGDTLTSVTGNFLGLRADGTTAAGNGIAGVFVATADNDVGGTTSAARNVIGSNSLYGVHLSGNTATGNDVQGNFIGTNAAGTARRGNGFAGVRIDAGASNNVIGGSAVGAGNLISGNDAHGVQLLGAPATPTTGNVIRGNFIGTNATGTAVVVAGVNLGNGGDGVLVNGGPAAVTGTVIDGNVISGNGTSTLLLGRHGIEITGSGATNTVVSGNRIGTNAAGTPPVGTPSLGNVFDGVNVNDGASGVAIRGNVISANGLDGVEFNGAGVGSVVQSNFIGTNVDGSIPLGNGGTGVLVIATLPVIIGIDDNDPTSDATDGNVISANAVGVSLQTNNSIVAGNKIGTNARGTAMLGNLGAGVSVGGDTNRIGTDVDGLFDALETNVISGNVNGVQISGTSATNNVVAGNLIGTNAFFDPSVMVGDEVQAGTLDLGNAMRGVFLQNGASNNRIGGATAAERNVISGNNVANVAIAGATSLGNNVSGNFIGTNAAGTAPLEPTAMNVGVLLDGAAANTIGGNTTTPGAGLGNVISGNFVGVSVIGASGASFITGNVIGLNQAGNALVLAAGATLPRQSIGVSVADVANGITVGSALGRNVVSGNVEVGVFVRGNASSTTIQNNFVGTDLTGEMDFGNQRGIRIEGPVTTVMVGGAAAGTGNVVSGNEVVGIQVANVGGMPTSVTIQGNFVGTDDDGEQAIGNGPSGPGSSGANFAAVSVADLSNVITIRNNVISGNNATGLRLNNTHNAVIEGNRVGTNRDGSAAPFDLGNTQHGVLLDGTSSNNTLGGLTSAEVNVISLNNLDGVRLEGAGMNNRVLSNLIGLDQTGNVDLGNSGNGVSVIASVGTMIRSNFISGNEGHGVSITGGTMTTVSANAIGTNVIGTTRLGNAMDGVFVAASGNTLVGNRISANSMHGIELSSGTNNDVAGNLIGLNEPATMVLGNGMDGINLNTQATGNRIGGLTAAERNVISGNSGNGIQIGGASNVVRGNFIGTDRTGAANPALGNLGSGVLIFNAASNVVGGPEMGARNRINGNQQNGVEIFGGTSADTVVRNNEIAVNLVDGIRVTNAPRARVQDNDVSGQGRHGIHVEGGAADTTLVANRISSNVADGVLLENTVRTLVQTVRANGNSGHGIHLNGAVLTTIQDSQAQRNAQTGIYVEGTSSVANTILATVISANGGNGINLVGAVQTTIQTSLINSNGLNGIRIEANGTIVGESAQSAQNLGADFVPAPTNGNGNTIVNNRGAGVTIIFGTQNTIRQNAIHSNTGLPIDLGGNGPTANDVGDLDPLPGDTTNANGLQNFPTLTRLSSFGGFTVLRGTFTGRPNTNYVFDLYVSSPDPTTPDARSFFGQINVVTNDSGTAVLSRVFQSTLADATITVTATDPLGNTSELSPSIPVGDTPVVTTEFLRYYAVGASQGAQGVVKLFNAVDNRELTTLTPFGPTYTGGLRVATGDVNGDGIAELVVATGVGGNSHVKVFDGASVFSINPQELYSFFAFPGFQGGTYVAVGDVNGDGRGDVIVGSGAGGHAHYKVFDGSSAGPVPQLLVSRLAFEAYEGEIRVGAGEFTGDKRAEVIVGASSVPHVKVIEAMNDTLVLSQVIRFTGATDFRGGIYVAGGDVNGDGFDELIVSAGSHQNAPGSQAIGPQVVVFSVANQRQATPFFAYDQGFQGGVRVAVTDRDSDGLVEILTVPELGAGSEVHVFDLDTNTFAGAGLIADPFFALQDQLLVGAFVG